MRACGLNAETALRLPREAFLPQLDTTTLAECAYPMAPPPAATPA